MGELVSLTLDAIVRCYLHRTQGGRDSSAMKVLDTRQTNLGENKIVTSFRRVGGACRAIEDDRQACPVCTSVPRYQPTTFVQPKTLAYGRSWLCSKP